MSETAIVESKIKEIKKEWEVKRNIENHKEKPDEKEDPQKMIVFLNNIDKQVEKVKSDWLRVCDATELLDMGWGDKEKLDSIEDEIKGLKEVWTELIWVWSSIEQFGETNFTAVVPKKIKDFLDQASQQLAELPARMRTYEDYENMKQRVKKIQQ